MKIWLKSVKRPFLAHTLTLIGVDIGLYLMFSIGAGGVCGGCVRSVCECVESGRDCCYTVSLGNFTSERHLKLFMGLTEFRHTKKHKPQRMVAYRKKI